RSAHSKAEVVAAEWLARGRKIIAGVQFVVAQKLIGGAMRIVGPTLGDDIELAASSDAELGAIVAAEGAELGHGFDIGRQRGSPVSAGVDVVAAVQKPGIVCGAD